MSDNSHRFPAILIGGPPHTGKSVLARSLKDALKQAGIPHYGFSAAPDGEGDWSQDAPPEVVRAQRRKGAFTPAWVERIRRDLARRPLPFLIDVGGRPEPWQKVIFDHCTHAILLVTDADSQATWQAMMDEYNIVVIALLTSQPEGESILAADRPLVRGTITNLRRHQQAAGPVFEALLSRIKALFNYDYDQLLQLHQRQAPTDLVIDLRKLFRRLNSTRPGQRWEPSDLPGILNYLPTDTPLALYGIGPVWLYTAVACHTFPASFYQFDGRRGWVLPVSFSTGAAGVPIKVISRETGDFLHLKLELPEDYLEYQEQMSLPLPPVPPHKTVVLDGKGPAWLYTGLALFYRQAPEIAVYQPQLNQAITIFSTAEARRHPIGDTFDYNPIE
ncbi:MAG: CRISPR-associated protein Csx3, partial [Chloroflexota bacterium]